MAQKESHKAVEQAQQEPDTGFWIHVMGAERETPRYQVVSLRIVYSDHPFLPSAPLY